MSIGLHVLVYIVDEEPSRGGNNVHPQLSLVTHLCFSQEPWQQGIIPVVIQKDIVSQCLFLLLVSHWGGGAEQCLVV